MRHGIPTADPLSPLVQDWWKKTAQEVYRAIPDLVGFLVKADSEGRPGPFTYGRNHADGANMLADAVRPFGGKIIWRCFVYNCRQDWRDVQTDRPKAAWEHYAFLDGEFADNVILQVKHGPFDFQVREPLSPLLLGMKQTNLAMELQLAQEYTGHQIDLYTMIPMWKEIFEELPADNIMSVAAVSNLGRDDNYTGHPLAAVNFYTFGLMAWDPETHAESAVSEWIRLTYGFRSEDEKALLKVLLGSRRTYEKYTAPLGIGWMITPHDHYGPNPSGYEYDLWGTYHKANREAVGIDRTEKGTGYLLQYPEELQKKYGLTMYNATSACVNEVPVKHSNHKSVYVIDFKMACQIIRRYYYLYNDKPYSMIYAEIASYINPIRPGRKDERNLKSRPPVSFLYRVA